MTLHTLTMDVEKMRMMMTMVMTMSKITRTIDYYYYLPLLGNILSSYIYRSTVYTIIVIAIVYVVYS